MVTGSGVRPDEAPILIQIKENTSRDFIVEPVRNPACEAQMKFVLFMLGVIAATTVHSTSSKAQNYPWCAFYSGGAVSGGTNCGFITFEQCMDTARGLGSFCQPNTQYQPPPGPHPITTFQRRYRY
jgi:hypothetical protein